MDMPGLPSSIRWGRLHIALLVLVMLGCGEVEQPTRMTASKQPSPGDVQLAKHDGARKRVSPASFRPEFGVVLRDDMVRPCQALSPAAPHCIVGVDCAGCDRCRGEGEARWEAARVIPWQAFAQGEYVGHARSSHVPEYRLRVDDQLEFRYRLTREETSTPYQLSVGDLLRVESLTDEKLNRQVTVQPDGTITLLLLGEVRVTRRTVSQLRGEVETLYKKYYKVPAITITPVETNKKLADVVASVDATQGIGGQRIEARVAPDGTVALPAIGSSVPAQGLTLEELKREIIERYSSVAKIDGLEVTPRLVQRAPRFVYVLGEVNQPGRYVLEGPTTAMQAVALAGSWRIGANLRQVIIFRRGDDWRLMATKLDLQGALLGARPCPADEIWLNDSDIVLVPKNPVQILDDWIELIFTRGIYGVMPFSGITLNFSKLSSI